MFRAYVTVIRNSWTENENCEVKTIKKAIAILIVMILVLALLAGLAFAAVLHYSAKLNREVFPETELSFNELFSNVGSKAVTNILLIGVDNDNMAGMQDLGNADGLILVSINKDTKQIVLTSFMRDIKVELPEGGYTKLTSSYHKGGTPMLIETMEKNFGVPIDNYVLVNYLNVVEIVDAVGGITMDVTADELYHMEIKVRNINGLLGLDPNANMIPPENAGTLTLNGVQTAAYLRVRMAGNNDVERTERARNVLLKLKDKLLEMSASELNSFANTALPCITTDMDQGDILKLMLGAVGYMNYEMLSNRVPVDDSYYYSQDGNAFVVIDYDVNRAALQNIIYN